MELNFFRKLLKGLRYVPRVIITDKLKGNSAAKAEVLKIGRMGRGDLRRGDLN